MSTLSLKNRLLIAATFTLIAFLGLAGVALDRAYINSARVSIRNQLKTQILALLTALEVESDGQLQIPEQLPESRLAAPNSGLYAFILNREAVSIWRSDSAVGINLGQKVTEQPGEESFFQVGDSLNSPFFHSFGVSWEIRPGKDFQFTLIVIEESDHFREFIGAHRRQLVFWLGMAGVLLLVMQVISLRWGLTPLARVTEELDQIEHARQEKILGDYPREIAQLSQRINLFLENERENLARYRNTLGDLAHSLKTPLAVIKGAMEQTREIDRDTINEHIDRMSKIMEYQLKRAASSQISVMRSAVNIAPVMHKIDSSLHKVYADKNIRSDWQVEHDAVFFGDEGELYELLGNLMDNAFKWTRSSVNYAVTAIPGKFSIHNGVKIRIEDDGPGIEQNLRQSVLKRGARVDQQVPGQGIGLAVAREIIERYSGELAIDQGQLGGTSIQITFPPSG